MNSGRPCYTRGRSALQAIPRDAKGRSRAVPHGSPLRRSVRGVLALASGGLSVGVAVGAAVVANLVSGNAVVVGVGLSVGEAVAVCSQAAGSSGYRS